MKVFKKRRREFQTTRAASLECTPIKNQEVREIRTESGEVLLVYPIRIRPWLSGLFRRFQKTSESTLTKKLQLDELGTAVWDLLDGHRTVRQVIGKFAEMHRLHPREAEVSVTQFLRELGKRGLVGLR